MRHPRFGGDERVHRPKMEDSRHRNFMDRSRAFDSPVLSDEDDEDTDPVLPLVLRGGDASEDSDEDTQQEQATASASLAPSATVDAAGASGDALPDAAEWSRLGDAAFLYVAPKDEKADAFWRPSAVDELTREERQRRAEAAAAASGMPMSLPANRYGRGMNSLQLAVELSGRAVARAHGHDADARNKRSASTRSAAEEAHLHGHHVGSGAQQRKRPTHRWDYET